MKAELPLLDGHNTALLSKKKKDNIFIKPKLASLHTSAEHLKNDSDLLVIPVTSLTDLQFNKLQSLPGAFLKTRDKKVSQEEKLLTNCQEPEAENKIATLRQRFLVKQSTKLISITIDQIAYFYADNRLNFIKTWNNKSYIIDKTIEETSKILNKEDFFRINRSFIISYKSIEEIHIHFNNRLKLKLNVNVPEEIFVSKDRVANFKQWLGA